MLTQIEKSKSGLISGLVRAVAKREGVAAEFLRQGIAKGHIVITNNNLRRIEIPCAIGAGLSTKINANIGTSKDSSNLTNEIRKMNVAIDLGADTIMDLSTGANIRNTRRKILKMSRVPVGTVPIYEMVIESLKKHGSISGMTVNEMFGILESQAEDGVDFFTIHAGVTKKVLLSLKKHPRIMDIVSRGGAFISKWMAENNRENPFYEYFDRVIDIAKKYDITLSLGDGLRPGAIKDATDMPQIMELTTLGRLQKMAFKRGVQVIIEGPGHVPLNQIDKNMALENRLCNGAPFYVLGPLVTDIAPGYDHITAAIGGAIAAARGASYLCYVTPAEHLRLPTLEDVREGVVASKIAAHAGDIAKGIKGAAQRDIAISKARARRDWKTQFLLAIDKDKPMAYRKSSLPGTNDVCTMCGEYCSIKMRQSQR